MDVLALHRVRIEPSWTSSSGRRAPSASSPAPTAPKRTPVRVHGGTLTEAQADQVERMVEASKGARLAAALAAGGSTQAGIDWLMSSDP